MQRQHFTIYCLFVVLESTLRRRHTQLHLRGGGPQMHCHGVGIAAERGRRLSKKNLA